MILHSEMTSTGVHIYGDILSLVLMNSVELAKQFDCKEKKSDLFMNSAQLHLSNMIMFHCTVSITPLEMTGGLREP